MRFLVDCQILDAVQQLVQREGELLAAVAFWGRGAGQQTGIAERAKPTRILCDLLSGACNPAEITCLRRNVHVEVKYRPHLHAKVWMNGNEVVVGSANASMNGLGFENGASNIEGAVHLCDEEVAQNVQDWFCREWDLAECVDDALLETATELWNQTRNRGGAIMNCRIIAYEASKLSEEARGRFGQIAPSHYAENDLGEIHDRAEGDSHPADETCYEFWPDAALPAPGTVYMDYHRDENGQYVKFNGFWETIHNEGINENGHTLCLLKQRSNREFRAPNGCCGRGGIGTMVKCWLDNRDEAYLDLEIRAFYFLQQKRHCNNLEQQCKKCPFRE